jgi:hypothetical protein
MIVTVGAMAIPLLWQSPHLSPMAKRVWMVLGILNTLFALLFLAILGPVMERFLQDLQAASLGVP